VARLVSPLWGFGRTFGKIIVGKVTPGFHPGLNCAAPLGLVSEDRGFWCSLFVPMVAGASQATLLTSEVPSPSPLRCFLEVLILNDFKSFEPEVLILRDFKSLFPEVLITEGLKDLRMSGLRESENFLEVLILDELGHSKCTNGWN
jgi:hypothetical protein